MNTVSGAARSGRWLGVDLFRYLLCFQVALIHSFPAYSPTLSDVVRTTNLDACRGAVPFFLVSGGYFLTTGSLSFGKVCRRVFLRILPAYVLWFCLYNGYAAVQTGVVPFSAVSLLTGGVAFHLWFLPALGCSLLAIASGELYLGWRTTAAIAVLLAIAGMVVGTYHSLFGIDMFRGTRLLCSPAFVLLGYHIARSRWRPDWKAASVLVVAAAGLAFLERDLTVKYLVAGASPASFLVADFALGGSLLILSLAVEEFLHDSLLSRFGQFTLGIYASHLFFVWWLAGWIGNTTLVRVYALAIVATVAATALSVTAGRLPLLGKLFR